MTIGEVCLLTNNVPRLAEFYKQLLGVETEAMMRRISLSSRKEPP